MTYPSSLDELTDGVPSDGTAAATILGSVTYPHDDHHRALGTAVEAIETQLVGAYTSYTPTLTGLSSNPTLGSGSSATGYYRRLGHRVTGYVNITFGSSGAAAGSGAYLILLPVAPVNRAQPIGIGYLMDYSDNVRLVVAVGLVLPIVSPAADSKALILVTNTAGNGFGNGQNPASDSVPWTWDANDQISLKFDYEAASAT